MQDGLTFVGLLPDNSEQHLVKRVIGLPGDHVVCCDAGGQLTVNGAPLDEKYINPAEIPQVRDFDVVVPAGKVWVMGDNRNHSADSRAHMDTNGGFVNESDIEGKAAVIAWPLNRISALDNYPDVFRNVPARKQSKPTAMSVAPTLDYERRFRGSGARLLAGIDEVGRGALAGPVSVGIAVVDLEQQKLLADVRDSKLLKVADRERLVPLVQQWSVASAVGHASAKEIDDHGIIAALRLAGNRAWFAVLAAGVRPEVVLLDGSHNWLSPDLQPSLFDDAPAEPGCDAPVHTLVKADMQCLSVAAASIIAKVERDADDVRAAQRVPGLRLGREQGLRYRRAQGGAARPPVPRRTTGSAGSCSKLRHAPAVAWRMRRAGARPAPDGARWNHECRGP